MLTIAIPGRDPLQLTHLLLDYNGTIALDGQLIPAVKPRLEALSRSLDISVITADTHGTAQRECAGLPVAVKVFPTDHVAEIKASEARSLSGGVVCIGNGYNDIQMSDQAALSICVMGQEGCCAALLGHADIVVTSITDALDLLLKPQRIRATLRT